MKKYIPLLIVLSAKLSLAVPPGRPLIPGTNQCQMYQDFQGNMTFVDFSTGPVTLKQLANAVGSGGGGGPATLPLPGGATNYVQNTSALQSNTTFYVSSGTVATSFTTTGATRLNNNAEVDIAGSGAVETDLNLTQTAFGVHTIGAQIRRLWYGNSLPNTFNAPLFLTNSNPGGAFLELDGIGGAGINGLQVGTTFYVNGNMAIGAGLTASGASPAPAGGLYVQNGIITSSMTVNGPGNGQVIFTISGSTYAVTSSSNTGNAVTVGHVAVYSSTNGTLTDGGVPGGGGGTAAGGLYSVQFSSPAGTFAGDQKFTYNGSTVTVSTGSVVVASSVSVSLPGDNVPFRSWNNFQTESPPIFNYHAGDDFTNNTAQDLAIFFSRSVSDMFTIQQTLLGNNASIAFKDPGGYPRNFFLSYQGGGGVNIFQNNLSHDVSMSATPVNNNGRLLFGVGTSSATVMIDSNTHVNFEGNAPPVVSACGTSPSITQISRDNAGTITTGTASPTSCTLTFSRPFLNPPVCVISDSLTSVTSDVSAISKTAVTFSFSAAVTSVQIYYICIGND